MLLEKTYRSFARNGAALSDADKELYRQYTSELAELTLRFGQNALAATNAFTLNITTRSVWPSSRPSCARVWPPTLRPAASGGGP